MTKDKCSNCGTTKTTTFWTFEDNTVLCDKCHTHFGKQWQKEIDKKHRSKKPLFKRRWFPVLIFAILFFTTFLLYYAQNSDKNYSTPDDAPKSDNQIYVKNSQQPHLYCGDEQCNNGETCSTCSSDCGQCVYCGDGNCNNGETCDSCSSDCGKCAYCGDGKCNNDETCSSCSQDCGDCPKSHAFKAFLNEEPYYSDFCDKINPYDLSVRQAASQAIKNHPGAYSVDQLFDIYDWIKNNIAYQNVPLGGIPYPAKETLATESGDCKNQAVLIASMIRAIGGTAKVVADPSCEHAYTIVRFGSPDEDFSWFRDSVAEHYGKNVQVGYFTNDEGTWVIFDPAGGRYPGNTLEECDDSTKVYFIDSCLDCSNQYPNMPYTFGDKCYSECPEGTIHVNDYSCSPCPEEYWSYNNECVTCQTGYILGSDGKCHETCGDSTHYCITGVCRNGQCYKY